MLLPLPVGRGELRVTAVPNNNHHTNYKITYPVASLRLREMADSALFP